MRFSPLARTLAFGLTLIGAFPAFSQAHRDPLSEKETDQLAELADQPDDRLKFYLNLVEARTTAIQQLTTRARDHDRSSRLRALFEEFTFLLDELGDNLDHYSDIHADVRKSLKLLIPASGKWPELLNQFPADPGYDFPRKSALDAAVDVHDSAVKLLPELESYLVAQKAQQKAEEKAKNKAR